MERPVTTKEGGICVSLSGGGYRAAAFGLGALLALADLRLARRIRAISSVSGGSITNAFAATALFTHGDEEEPDHWDRASRLLRLLSHRDLVSVLQYLLVVGLSCGYLALLGAAVSGVLGTSPPWLLLLLAGAVVCGAVGYLSLRTRAAGRLHLHLLSREVDHVEVAKLLRAVAQLFVYGCTRQLRKFRRLAGQTFPESIWALTLSDLHSSYRPVFCTTDLGRGTHVYLSDRFVAGVSTVLPYDQRGQRVDMVSAAPAWPVANAVMASAAFPGVFQPVTVPMSELGFPDPRGSAPARLADGGLYDNLGFTFPKAWFEGRLAPAIEGDVGPPPSIFVGIDSGSFALEDARWQDPVRSFKRSVAIVHQANSSARQEQTQAFVNQDGVLGAIVHIGDDPFEVAERQEPQDKAELLRALERLAADDRRIGRSWWQSVARHLNPAVRTELKGLGPETTARLVFHGYANTLACVMPLLGCKVPEKLPTLRELERQCAERTTRRRSRRPALGRPVADPHDDAAP